MFRGLTIISHQTIFTTTYINHHIRDNPPDEGQILHWIENELDEKIRFEQISKIFHF